LSDIGNFEDSLKANSLNSVNVIDLIKSKDNPLTKYFIIPASPATGILFVTYNNPGFISGDIRLRGKDQGRYPYKYLEMINNLFGVEKNTIEVCSRSVRGSKESPCFTVDINPDTKPDLVDDGQVLRHIPNNKFNRWRCDPPYNQSTSHRMYGTSLPRPIELLKAGARVCKVGSLMFLLLGPQNYQWCPPGVKRIGLVYASIIPNNETRCLNIYYKYADNKV
jgi:hypothetical protein